MRIGSARGSGSARVLYNRGLLCGVGLQVYFIIGVCCVQWVCKSTL